MFEDVLEHQAARSVGRNHEGRYARPELPAVLTEERRSVRRRIDVIVEAAMLVVDDDQHRLVPAVGIGLPRK